MFDPHLYTPLPCSLAKVRSARENATALMSVGTVDSLSLATRVWACLTATSPDTIALLAS